MIPRGHLGERAPPLGAPVFGAVGNVRAEREGARSNPAGSPLLIQLNHPQASPWLHLSSAGTGGLMQANERPNIKSF